MRIGTTVGLQLDGPQTIDDIVEEVRHVAALGLDSAWWAQVFSWDALTALTVAGVNVPNLQMGTSVVTTYPRHPLALAGQALSAQAAIGNRLTLGIGPSHKPLVESMLGLEFDRPALHTREYLDALIPLLRGEAVETQGEIHNVTGQVAVTGAEPPPVLLAALGPVMLRIAGELADGTIAAWSGVRALGEHIVPRITAAAEAAGRPTPRVAVQVLIGVTENEDAARTWAAEHFGAAAAMPSYRAVLDLGGADGIGEVVVAGDESGVERQLRQLEDAGATEFIAVPYGPPEQVTRTLRALADLNDASQAKAVHAKA